MKSNIGFFAFTTCQKVSSYPHNGPRSFAVARPTTWNNLAKYLRDPELPIDNNFRRQ